MTDNSAEARAKKPVALVTAGASGIGRCIAETLMADGYRVHIADINSESTEAFLSAYPGATASRVDISKPDAVKHLFTEFTRYYDRLDVLVNNAGVAGPTAAVEDIAVDDWKTTIDVDLNGTFYVTRLAVPMLKAAGAGVIINIASTAALHGYPLRSPYAAAKWALVGLTKTWAMELGPESIRVNAICPGSVNGERIENVINKDAQERGVSPSHIREVYQRQTSMRLFVDPQDIANMVTFLCSHAGARISGQVIAVDGHTEGLSNWLD